MYIHMSYVYAYVLHIFHSIYNVQRKNSILHLSGGHINVDFMFALFMYTYIHIHMYMSTYTYTYVYIRIHVYTHTHKYKQI